ncbi:MAG: hypothetical protein F6K24_27465 [Okeania sp. SIO2D1]|nr:hypothetical protein [Okeania sp. SIO2D1]
MLRIRMLGFLGSTQPTSTGDDLSGHQHNPFYVSDSNDRYYQEIRRT